MGGYSKGCITCRKRKVKCDELQPSCLRCVKKGVACGGYSKGPLKITYYGRFLSRERYGSANSPPRETIDTNTPSDVSPPFAWLEFDRSHSSSPLDSLPVSYENLGVLDVESFARVQSLRQGPAKSTSITLQKKYFAPAWPAPNSSWVSYIPARLGQSVVLDDAVVCVIHAFDAFMADRSVNDHVTTYYLRALRSLNNALLGGEAYSADTLCAVMLLGVYEVISSSEASSWIMHAGGASRLMQLRGTERWTTDFEKTLFQAHLPVIITEAIMLNKPCFLESKQWRSAIMDSNPSSELHYPSRAHFFALGPSRARLQRDITNLLADKATMRDLEACQLLARIKERAADRRKWFQTWALDVENELGCHISHFQRSSAFRARIFGSELDIIQYRDIRAYIGFCNTYCHSNIFNLSLEPCERLMIETLEIAEEINNAVQYLVQNDNSETSHVSGGLATAQLVWDLMIEWADEFETRRMSQTPGGNFVSFKLWLKYLHVHGVRSGFEDKISCLTSS